MDENGITPVREARNIEPVNGRSLREEEILAVAPEDAARLLDYWHIIMKRRWTVITFLLVIFTTVAIGRFKICPEFFPTARFKGSRRILRIYSGDTRN